MRTFRNGLTVAIVLMTFLAGGLVAGAAPDGVANEHFQRTWDRTDRAVAEDVVDRTWIWGSAISGELSEPYSDALSGERTVQYFDKSRMEITHPDSGDPASPWYVTNGLLVRELITGWVQVGDATYEPGLPSELNVAGDQGFPNGPSYATFRNLMIDYLQDPEYRVGEIVDEYIDRGGVIDERAEFADNGIVIAHFDEVTRHNIAAPFWEFMNSTGLIFAGGEYSDAPLFENPYYATGRPLIEPYWSDVVVAGTEKLVLVQCFERRCLTFTPDNPEGWQVEAGNVGQHYYEWRYRDVPAPPGQILYWDYTFDEVAGRYVSKIFTISADGTDRRNLTPDFHGDVSGAVWSPDGNRIAFAVDGDLYAMNADGSNIDQITSGEGIDAAPDWSPDGDRIAFQRALPNGTTQVFVVDSAGGNEQQLTSIPAEGGTGISHDPTWSPGGDRIAFVSTSGVAPPTLPATLYLINADGSGLRALTSSWLIVDLQWSLDGESLFFEEGTTGGHDLIGGAIHAVDLTADPVEDRILIGEDGTFPRAFDLSPDGSRLAMVKKARAYDESPSGIVTTNLAGEDLTQLTHLGENLDWSPDGQTIAFSAWTRVPDTQESVELIGVVSADGSDMRIVSVGGYDPLWRP